jgi:protoporphyrinogen oxidase
VYFPEAEFLVNRISYPCTFSTSNGPADHWSLQAEITCARDSSVWHLSEAEILAHTKQGLRQRKLLPSDEQIVFEQVDRLEHAYVVYDTGYEKNASKVRAWFASIGIHLLGRFSYFEYINVDMAVDRAIKLAASLNGEAVNEETKTRYLTRALARVC